MKKFITLFLALMLVFSLAACGGKEEAKKETEAPKETEDPAVAAAEAYKNEVAELIKTMNEGYYIEGDCINCDNQCEGDSIVCDECWSVTVCDTCEKDLAEGEYILCKECKTSLEEFYADYEPEDEDINAIGTVCMACGTGLSEDDAEGLCADCTARVNCYFCLEDLGEGEVGYHYECWEEYTYGTSDDTDTDFDEDTEGDACAVCGAELTAAEFYWCTECTERTTCYYCEEALEEGDTAYHYSCWEDNLWFGDEDTEATCWICDAVLEEGEEFYCADCLASDEY